MGRRLAETWRGPVGFAAAGPGGKKLQNSPRTAPASSRSAERIRNDRAATPAAARRVQSFQFGAGAESQLRPGAAQPGGRGAAKPLQSTASPAEGHAVIADPARPPPLAPRSRSAPSSRPPTTNPISVARKASTPESTRTTTPASDRIQEIQVTRLADEPVVRPAQEVSLAPLTQTGALDNRGETAPAPLTSTKPDAKTDKRGLFSRMIPFGGKPKPGTDPTTSAPSSEVALNGRSPDDAVDTNPVRPTPPPVARYAYRSPVRPG